MWPKSVSAIAEKNCSTSSSDIHPGTSASSRLYWAMYELMTKGTRLPTNIPTTTRHKHSRNVFLCEVVFYCGIKSLLFWDDVGKLTQNHERLLWLRTNIATTTQHGQCRNASFWMFLFYFLNQFALCLERWRKFNKTSLKSCYKEPSWQQKHREVQ